MSIIYVLIPIAVLLTAIGIYLFFWAVKTEQFDDLEKQGMSILFDDDADKHINDNSHNSAGEKEISDERSTTQEHVKSSVKK